MAKYHINPETQNPGVCSAEEGNCPFGVNAPHFTTLKEAKIEVERKASEENPTTTTLKKEVRYSFTKSFQQQVQKFEEDFEGYPTRFFNTDLREKVVYTQRIRNFDPIKKEIVYQDQLVIRTDDLNNKMMLSASQPKDLTISDEAAEKLFTKLGVEETYTVIDPQVARSFKGERLWRITYNGREHLVVDGAMGQKNFSKYLFKRQVHDFGERNLIVMDLRALAGASRVQHTTGENLFHQAITRRDTPTTGGEAIITFNEERRRKALETLTKLEEAQLEGSNMKAQQKYVRENSGKVASAWEDKKGTDKVHQELAKSSPLKSHFRLVEVDNDVDPKEFREFEEAFQEVQEKLPPIPKERQPELRIRRLGKHRAAGLYHPGKNTLMIDIHDSSSAIHELGHYYDLTVKNNASLSKEFREVIGEYAKNLQLDGSSAKGVDYYTTPTEVFARGWELYAHERLGVENRLLNPERFTQADYKPFTENPSLKERVFSTMDNLFKG